MTRLKLFLSLLALGLVAGAIAAPDPIFDAVLQRPAKRGTLVVPDTFLRPWDPITVFYERDMGSPGPEDHPDVTLAPAHPGAWTWLDARTLQFRPAEPWPGMARFTVTADGGRTDLATLMPAPTEVRPFAGAKELGPVESLSLTFPFAVPEAQLSRMLTIELRPLPGLGTEAVRQLTHDDFLVKEVSRKDAGVTYAITLDHPIPLGTRATIRLQLSADHADVAVSTSTFATARPFRITGLGCPSRVVPVSPTGTRWSEDEPVQCGDRRRISVEFSARPQDLDDVQARNLVRLEPSVQDLQIRQAGRWLLLDGDFDRDRPYRVTVTPGGATGIVDARGRPLDIDGDSAVSVWFPSREPFLRLDAGHGILERHGPQTVPVSGRNHQQADLRLYKVDPLNRSLWPFPATGVAVDESQRPPGPGEAAEEWTHLGHIDARGLAERLTALGSPGVSTLVDLPLEARDGAARFGLDLEPHLQALGGDKPGHYLVGLRPLDGANQRTWMRVQVTDLSLTTIDEDQRIVFLVTSLSTGAPVNGAIVAIEGTRHVDGKPRWDSLAEVTTGADGRAVFDAPGPRKVTVSRVSVHKGSDWLVLDPTRPPDSYRDGHWKADGHWLSWAWSNLAHRGEPARHVAHLFAERPIYRPEEPVHLRGYVRRRISGKVVGASGSGHLLIRGPGGSEWRKEVELTGQGDVYALFDEKTIPSGTYTVTFHHDDGWTVGDASFQVEAYRLPRFEVKLHTPQNAALDAPFDVKLTASYFAGGRVSARPIRWRVMQFPYAWQPASMPGFVWSSDGRYGQNRRFESTPRLVRHGTTGPDGEALLALDPTIEPTAQPRTYVVEATVTGADEQTVTDVRRVHAVPPFVLGAKVPRFLPEAKQISPEIAVAGPDGKLLAGKEVTVRLKHRQWHSHLQASDFTTGSARYVTEVVDEAVAEKRIKSRSEPVKVRFGIDTAGVYVVELEARDKLGRTQVVEVDLFAAGDSQVTWDKPKAGIFEITGDADRYAPGETAHLVVRSPFPRARALAVIETPEGNRYQPLEVRGGKATIRLAVEPTWVPRIPVHVLLYRGRTGTPDKQTGLDLGKPTTVASTHWLQVEPTEHQLHVELDHVERALPGETVPITLTLSDDDGEPVGGIATLWLVDRAVLSLGHEARLDPVPDFITPRHSRMRLVDSRNLAFGRVPWDEMPGGDGDEEDAEGDPLDKATVRRNFQPVPFYQHDIVVPEGGTITVDVPLSDDLTTFAVRAKAVSGPDRFGAGKSAIQVRLPIVVQPALPRFVRPGDAFTATGVARVIEGDGGAGQVSLRAEGLQVDGGRSDMHWSVTEPSRVGFPVVVDTPPMGDDGTWSRHRVGITLGVSRAEDGATDAFEARLPLLPDRREQVSQTLVTLGSEPLNLAGIADEARPGSVKRTIVVASDPALVRMAAGLDFLHRHPAGTTDERLSQARTMLALGRFRAQMGQRDDADTELDVAVADTLAWLPAVIDDQGRVAQWPGARGSIWLTASTAHFLVEARAQGFRVEDGLSTTITRTLEKALRSDYIGFVDGESWWERTTALEALAASGRFDGAYFSELGRNARWLDAEGTARVVTAGWRGKQLDAPMGHQLVGQVEDSVLVRLNAGEERYASLSGLDTVHSPLILPSEARALSHVVRALAVSGSTSPRAALATSALVQLGTENGWGNAHTNAAALLALSSVLETTDPVTVKVTDGPHTESLTTSEGIARYTSDQLGQLSLSLEDGDEAAVWITTRWIPAAPGSEAEAEQHGFVVERTLREAVQLGEVVEEHVRVINAEDRHYVTLTVPLAAGVEVLNPRLRNAPAEARPSQPDTVSATWKNLGDDAVVYAFEHLPAGSYDFWFRVRATQQGQFIQPPARAEMVYAPAVWGQSDGAAVTVP